MTLAGETITITWSDGKPHEFKRVPVKKLSFFGS
jgi:hypothetical protein